jgi:hypothetical protein
MSTGYGVWLPPPPSESVHFRVTLKSGLRSVREVERFATPRRSRGIGAIAVAGAVLAVIACGCGPAKQGSADPPKHVVGATLSPTASASATPTSTATPLTGTPVPQATPDTLPVHTVLVGMCCTVSVPEDWFVNGPDATDAYVAEGSNPALVFTLTQVGTSSSCPAEPASAQDESRSVVRHDPLTINGESVTAWVTADADTTYQYIDADVTVAGLCVDVGGDEFGVASAANRPFLEGIMRSVAAVTSPTPSPSASPSPSA